jgi:hypothetical protein
MWSKEPHPTEYPVTGRILNRHKRGRPRFKIWQRLKSRGMKAIIPIGVFGLIGLAVWLADWAGVI